MFTCSPLQVFQAPSSKKHLTGWMLPLPHHPRHHPECVMSTNKGIPSAIIYQAISCQRKSGKMLSFPIHHALFVLLQLSRVCLSIHGWVNEEGKPPNRWGKLVRSPSPHSLIYYPGISTTGAVFLLLWVYQFVRISRKKKLLDNLLIAETLVKLSRSFSF